MVYPNGDEGKQAIVNVKCGVSNILELVDQNPIGTFNFNFYTLGACKKVITLFDTNIL